MADPTDDKSNEIKVTYVNSTRGQRNVWVSMLRRHNERTGENLKLSDWVIMHLPKSDIHPSAFVESCQTFSDADLPDAWSEFCGAGVRHFVYMNSVLISERDDGKYSFIADGIDHVCENLDYLETVAFEWHAR